MHSESTSRGRTNLWEQYTKMRDEQRASNPVDITNALSGSRGGIGTPDDLREHLLKFEECGVDQVTFIQQAGNNKHEDICESLEIFAKEVMGEFKEREQEREEKKMRELQPYLDAAMERKIMMEELSDDEIPTFMSLGRRVSEDSKKEKSIYEAPSKAAGG